MVCWKNGKMSLELGEIWLSCKGIFWDVGRPCFEFIQFIPGPFATTKGWMTWTNDLRKVNERIGSKAKNPRSLENPKDYSKRKASDGRDGSMIQCLLLLCIQCNAEILNLTFRIPTKINQNIRASKSVFFWYLSCQPPLFFGKQPLFFMQPPATTMGRP